MYYFFLEPMYRTYRTDTRTDFDTQWNLNTCVRVKFEWVGWKWEPSC